MGAGNRNRYDNAGEINFAEQMCIVFKSSGGATPAITKKIP